MIELEPTSSPSGVPLASLVLDALSLDAEAFQRRHGEAFLLQYEAGNGSGGGPAVNVGTQMVEGPAKPKARPQLDFTVFALRKHARGGYSTHIAIGRDANKDVFLDDASVSRFHAFVLRKNDDFFIQDGGSKNGTFVDERRVAPKDQGAPSPLHEGATVRLGQVRLSFLTADRLRSLVKRVGAVT